MAWLKRVQLKGFFARVQIERARATQAKLDSGKKCEMTALKTQYEGAREEVVLELPLANSRSEQPGAYDREPGDESEHVVVGFGGGEEGQVSEANVVPPRRGSMLDLFKEKASKKVASAATFVHAASTNMRLPRQESEIQNTGNGNLQARPWADSPPNLDMSIDDAEDVGGEGKVIQSISHACILLQSLN
jgi:hypothetical protein